ncbi:MAG: hypothetical protein ACXWIU_02610 [Limisphaerales bacterium]
MNFQARLTFVFVAFIAAFFYINLFSKPAEKNQQPKLYSATTNDVIAMFGQPLRVVDSTNFVESADQMAEDGYPVSSADMRPKGMVWLYLQGGVDRKGMQKYQTLFFDEDNRVYGVYTTCWMNDFWGGKE